MKNTDSTEMDRLLHRHFRQTGEALRGGSDKTQESNSTTHLDADEMNAYAEGALPEIARSRYFAHLADCDACRKLVTELTLASGVVSDEKRVVAAEPTPSKSWREWLAAILSPPVLRYGVPALALTAVIIVAIIAMRARRESDIAQNKEATRNSVLQSPASSNSASAAESSTTTAENHANANSASSNTAASIPEQAQTQPFASATPPPPKTMMEENAPTASSPSGGAKATESQNSILDKKQDKVEQEGRSGGVMTSTPAAAPPPAPVLSKPTTTGEDDRPKREEQKKPKATEKDTDETVAVTNSAGATATNQPENSEAPRDRGRRVASRSVQSLPMNRPSASKSASADEITEKESSSETRSISGRRFRKQGNSWVDTSYNSSRQTINIARGSEQYRALLADEPGLRAITQQLGGEVVVVWGKKAYRFY